MSHETDIAALIEKKMHPKDIAKILGMHLNAVRRLLPEDYKPKPPLATPFGLSQKSAPFRAFLADLLIDMSEKGLTRQQIANITGLNRHESCRAERRPFLHDWTLSQIERILQWNDIT